MVIQALYLQVQVEQVLLQVVVALGGVEPIWGLLAVALEVVLLLQTQQAVVVLGAKVLANKKTVPALNCHSRAVVQ
jgi:hypothetical protein